MRSFVAGDVVQFLEPGSHTLRRVTVLRPAEDADSYHAVPLPPFEARWPPVPAGIVVWLPATAERLWGASVGDEDLPF